MTTPLLFSRIASGDGSGGVTPPKRTDQSPPAGSPDFRALFRTMVAGLPPAHGSPSQPQSSVSDSLSDLNAHSTSSVARLAFSNMLGLHTTAQRSAFATTTVISATTATRISAVTATKTSATTNPPSVMRVQEQSASASRVSSMQSSSMQASSVQARVQSREYAETSKYSEVSKYGETSKQAVSASSKDDARQPVERMTLRDLAQVVTQVMRSRREQSQSISAQQANEPSNTSPKLIHTAKSIDGDSVISTDTQSQSAETNNMQSIISQSETMQSMGDSNGQQITRTQTEHAIKQSPQQSSDTTSDTVVIAQQNDGVEKNRTEQSDADVSSIVDTILVDILQAISLLMPQVLPQSQGAIPNAAVSDKQTQALLAGIMSAQGGHDVASAGMNNTDKSKDSLLAMMQAVQAPLQQFASAMSGLLSTLQSMQDSLGQNLLDGTSNTQSPITLQPLPDGNVGVVVSMGLEQLQIPLSPEHIQQWHTQAEQAMTAVNSALAMLQQSTQQQLPALPTDMRAMMQMSLQALAGQAQSASTQTMQPQGVSTPNIAQQKVGDSSDELLRTVIELALQNMAGIAPNDKNTEQPVVGVNSLQKQDFAPPHLVEIALQIPTVQNATSQYQTGQTALPTLGDIAGLVQQFSAQDSQAPSIKIMLTNTPASLNGSGFSVAANNQQAWEDSPLLANTLQNPIALPAQTDQPILPSNIADAVSSQATHTLSTPSISAPTAPLSTMAETVQSSVVQTMGVQAPVAETPSIQTVENTARAIASNAPRSPFQAAPTAVKQPMVSSVSDSAQGDAFAGQSIPLEQKAEITATASAGAQAGLQGDTTPQNMPFGHALPKPTPGTDDAVATSSTVPHQTGEQSATSHEAIGTEFELNDAKQSAQSTKLPVELMAKAGSQFAQIFKDVAPQDIPRTVMQAFRGFTPMAGGVGGVIQLQLNPEHLGGVMVQVLVKNMSASISIETDSAESQRAVEAQIASLKERLTAQGLKVETVEISTRPQNDPAGLDMHQQGQSSQAQRDDRESRQAFVESFRHQHGSGRNTNSGGESKESPTAQDILRRMKSGVSSNANALHGQRNFERYA
jgi:trimeric autotransporter adhesin